MITVSRSALVTYSDQQMFDLINDIEAYPEYMNGCIAAEVLERNEQCVKARLTLGKSGIQQSFTTANTLDVPKSMAMTLVEGPFKIFEGAWRFQSLNDNACKVSLDLKFELRNPLLTKAIGKWLESLANQQVDSLCQRAESVYG